MLVIIVTYNWEKRAKRVVECLNNSSQKVDTMIIDNGSTDKTLEIFNKWLKWKFIIEKNQNNLWFWWANNIWFEYAIKNNYEYVYLLNQDARFFEDTVENLIKLCKKNPNIWIISPFQCCDGVRNIDKNFQVNVCSFDSNKNIFSDIYFNDVKSLYEVSNVMAAHRLIPINVIKKIWWFSPTFPHYWEDDNYTDRVRYFWYKVYIAPWINVVHDRENRVDSPSKTIRLWYIYGLNLFSKPSDDGIKKYFKLFAINIYYAILYKSFKPIHNIIKILLNLHIIKHNKRISFSWECPFLNL